MATTKPVWSRMVDEQQLEATGPERLGWRVNVETPHGIHAYGVLVAPSDDLWRARILTMPNVLWLGPDGQFTLKFSGKTAQTAETKAIDFVREHCRRRGYTMRDELSLAEPKMAEVEAEGKNGNPDRKIRFLPVLFGLRHPAERGGTGNVSERGMFIITEDPAPQGETIFLRLQTETNEVDMQGSVRWSRKQHRIGRAPGMGVELLNPPVEYISYVRALM